MVLHKLVAFLVLLVTPALSLSNRMHGLKQLSLGHCWLETKGLILMSVVLQEHKPLDIDVDPQASHYRQKYKKRKKGQLNYIFREEHALQCKCMLRHLCESRHLFILVQSQSLLSRSAYF